MSGFSGSASLARKMSSTRSASAEAASHGLTRASTIEKSDPTNTFPGVATKAGRTRSASLRATGMSTGAAAARSAWLQPSAIMSTSAASLPPCSSTTSRIRFWICAPLLDRRPVCPAPANRYWHRSTPSTCCAAMRANFFGEAPAPNKRNVATSWAFASSALRPPLARFMSSMASRRSTRARVRLNFGSAWSFAAVIVVIIIINVIVYGDADRQHLAHDRVRKLVVDPGGDPFRLCDARDGAAGQLGQSAADDDRVLGRERRRAGDERHVDRHAAPIDVLEDLVLLPLLGR